MEKNREQVMGEGLSKEKPKNKWKITLQILGIIFIAANLRAPITSVGPVITEIKESLQLSPVLVSLVTTIPLISFAFLSTFAPAAARRTGLEKLLFYSMLTLALGLVARSTGSISLLFIGAALIGAAITVGNVLMPAIIKKEFPASVGLITGIYLVSMNIISALAAGFSFRIGNITGLGWQGSIGIWVIFTVLALLLWLPQLKKKEAVNPQTTIKTSHSVWKSKLAWCIAIYMGIQSFQFYSIAAWLPAIMQDWGMDADHSGWMLSYVQIAQIPVMLLGPIVAGKMKNQTPLVWICFVLLIAGLAGIILGRTDYIVISVILIGIALGLAFTLAMMFFVLRTKQAREAANLSGMSQTVGYLIAACGPPLFGLLYSLTSSWLPPLSMLIVAAIAMLITGLIAAKDRFVKM